MKNFLSILFFFSCVFAAPLPRLVVSVTLPPYAKILNEIGGARVETVQLVPANANPHVYEPKPLVIKQFSRVSLYLSDGSDLDKAWKPRFLGVNSKVKSVDISKGIAWIQTEDLDNPTHHEDHHGGELDPHLWTSPLALYTLSENILSALIKEDPQGKSYYESRYNQFKEKIDSLDSFLKTAVQSLPENRRTFVVFHPSYGYFARDYGLVQMAIEAGGKEPKPQDMKNLVLKAKERQVKIIFVQPQFNKRAAESIAKELGAKIVVTDPLSYDFEQNLRKLGDAILQSGVNQ